jgi:hypothetical protein
MCIRDSHGQKPVTHPVGHGTEHLSNARLERYYYTTLFGDDALGSSDSVVSSDRESSESLLWKCVEGSCCDQFWETVPSLDVARWTEDSQSRAEIWIQALLNRNESHHMATEFVDLCYQCFTVFPFTGLWPFLEPQNMFTLRRNVPIC